MKIPVAVVTDKIIYFVVQFYQQGKGNFKRYLSRYLFEGFSYCYKKTKYIFLLFVFLNFEDKNLYYNKL